MKLFELTRATAPVVTEETVRQQIQEFDWSFEFSQDEWRQTRGQKKLIELEKMVFEFWKKDPVKAVTIWNETAPCGLPNSNTIPEFIIRMSRQ